MNCRYITRTYIVRNVRKKIFTIFLESPHGFKGSLLKKFGVVLVCSFFSN